MGNTNYDKHREQLFKNPEFRRKYESMTTQEEIREGIAKHFRPHTLGDIEDDLSDFIVGVSVGTPELWGYKADELMEWLRSQGVKLGEPDMPHI